MRIKYRVDLTDEEREHLLGLIGNQYVRLGTIRLAQEDRANLEKRGLDRAEITFDLL
jgi:hypothetical protein